MTYTFWHSGVLIGESELEEAFDKPRQRGGAFHPTAYGLEIFPRISSILSVGHALRMHLDASGVSAEEMDKEEVVDLLENTVPGKRLIDIGRMLSEVEVRAPDGRRLDFSSIGFSDLLELRRLALELDGGVDDDPSETDFNGMRYMVSATFQEHAASEDDEAHAHVVRRREWSDDN